MVSALWDIVGDGPEGMENMESLQQLEERLGYTFTNSELLRSALYHSSYANEHRGMGIASNERLEFLGDAVLGFVSADYLYRKHPDLPEGELTRIRAALVCEESLHEVAQSLHLGDFLMLGKLWRRKNTLSYPLTRCLRCS